jgi:hypothetical protein
VLIYLLKNRSTLGAPAAPEGVEENSHYIASVTFTETKYATLDISFFIQIRNLIASTERLEDKKRHNSDADSPLVLAFVSPNTSVVAPPSATESGKRRKIALPQARPIFTRVPWNFSAAMARMPLMTNGLESTLPPNFICIILTCHYADVGETHYVSL